MLNSIMAKLTVALTFITLFLGGFVGYNWRLTNRVQHAMEDVEACVTEARDTASAMAIKAKDMQLHVVQVQQWLTDISATRAAEGFDDGFDEARDHADAFLALLGEFRAHFQEEGDDEAVMQADDLAQRFGDYYASGQKLAQAYIEGGPEAGNVMMLEFDEAAAAMAEAIDPFVQGQIDVLTQSMNQVQTDIGTTTQQARQIRSMSLALLGTIVVCSVLGWLALQRLIITPLSRVVLRLKDIAEGEGDLTKRVDQDRKDELGELGKWFNTFVVKVHGIIAEIAAGSYEVAGASTQIASASEEMATGLNEQASQITQISSAVEQMSASIQEVTRKSSQAADNARQAGDVAAAGGKVVDDTIEGMQGISEAVNASAASVSELGKRGEQIGQIIDVINDIADQTNLLALNAAIEAARAGEHGRGFAVVADEVRKLADRTTNATEEIAESITAIQTETHDAVRRMNAGTEQVQVGVSRATDAGKSLQEIVGSSQGVADMIGSIAAAAEEQAAASEQISRSIESITAVSTQASEGANQSASAATQLSAKAEQLQQIVRQFKLAEDAHAA